MESAIEELTARQKKQETEFLRVSQDLAQILNFVACPSEKSRLREFLNSCKADGPEPCSQQDIEMMTNWLITEKHVLLRVPDNAEPRISDIPPVRLSQLRELFLRPLPSTKLLLFVAPPKGTSQNYGLMENAMRTARKIQKFIATESIENLDRVRLLSPMVMRCETAADIARKYASRHNEDKPLISEPTGTSKTLLIWVFRVDC